MSLKSEAPSPPLPTPLQAPPLAYTLARVYSFAEIAAVSIESTDIIIVNMQNTN